MAYTPQSWVDGVTQAAAARMTAIENGIDTAHDLAEAVVSLARATPGTRLAAPINGTLNTSASAARPSSRTDIFFDWYSTVLPNNMIAGDTWEAPTT